MDDERIAKLEVKVDNLTSMIDNDVKHTLVKIWDKVNEMCPMVKENSYWVGLWKKTIFWLAVIGVGGGLVTFVFKLVGGIQ